MEEKIRTKSLSRQVLDALCKQIATDALQPGALIPTENELVETMGVSKSSVREAIKMMEALGMVEIRRGQGTVLTANATSGYANIIKNQIALGNGTPQELLAFRYMVESGYTEMAISTATAEDLQEIGVYVEKFAHALETGSLCGANDMDFHNSILHATHNPFVISIGEAVNGVFENSIGKAMVHYPMQTLEAHRAIYEGLCARDVEAVRRSIIESLHVWAEIL